MQLKKYNKIKTPGVMYINRFEYNTPNEINREKNNEVI